MYPPKPEPPAVRMILEPQGYRICHRVERYMWPRDIRDEPTGRNCKRLMGHGGECMPELSWWCGFLRQFGVK